MVVGPAAVVVGLHGQSFLSSPTRTPEFSRLDLALFGSNWRLKWQKKMLQRGTVCLFGADSVPCINGKSKVEERLEPFYLGGGTAFPCVLLNFNY